MKNKYCKQVLAVILAATMMAGTVSTADASGICQRGNTGRQKRATML